MCGFYPTPFRLLRFVAQALLRVPFISAWPLPCAMSSRAQRRAPDEMDAEMLSWLREAYRVGRQEHLKT